MANRKRVVSKSTPKIESGIVEGFYGRPWSRAARRRVIDAMPRLEFQTYIYAPKDDPFHRERWRESYPEAERRHLVSLVNHCKKLGVNFCWALSPGLSVRYSSPADFETLVGKYRWIAGLGVSTFALFLDDIPPELADKRDRKKWNSLAEAHVDLVNRLYKKVADSIKGSRLWFCPTEYIGTKPTPYLETIGKGINPDVGIFWTGPLVVSPRITVEDAKAIGSVLRRKPLLWDNYPVNDYNTSKLNLGPLRARDPNLLGFLGGYFTNPMNEATASAIPLQTIAAYLRDPTGYDPDKAWLEATAAPWGEPLSAGARRALRDFCGIWPAGFFFGEPPSPLLSALSEARDGRVAKLKKILTGIVELPELISKYDELRLFMRETRPFFRGLVLDAEAALVAVELQKNPENRPLQIKLRGILSRANKVPLRPASGNVLRTFAANNLNQLTK